MSETRSIGSQSERKRSTAVQTKRISKEELRYYTKIVEKEKQILLKFANAMQEYPILRQPHYTINMRRNQTKLHKNFGTRKKRKNKKHGSHKTKAKTSVEVESDQENTGHYVSKIVVDDATHCLKLRVRSCKKNQDSKENTAERVRSRKAKQPRRYNRNMETLTEHVNGDGEEIAIVESTDLPAASPPISVKHEGNKTDCLLAKSKSRDSLSSPSSSPLPTMTSQLTPILPPVLSDDEIVNGRAMSPGSQMITPDDPATSDDSNYHSPNEDSDDNQSVCSEEFFIVETTEENLNDERDKSHTKGEHGSTEETDINPEEELKNRLKANSKRKSSDCEQYEKSSKETSEQKVLPQVVSVHFYDPQTHSQRIVGADTSISFPQMARDTSMTLPYPESPTGSLTSPQRNVTSETPRPPQTTPPNIPPMNYPYTSYYPNTTDINTQYPAYQIPSIPPSTKARALPPKISSTSKRVTSHQHTETPNASASRTLLPETSGGKTLHPEATKQSVPKNPEQAHGEVMPSCTIEMQGSSEMTEIDIQSRKRKRFIFGSHEPPKKKVISSLLTPLCEREATRLADGIHEINMQYFPLRSLAQKAANRVSGDTDDILKLIDQKMQLKTKIQDVEKARNLLKDIYDMVLKSKEIEDIQNFELVSHNFGVRNILNHLSLVDLYFGELGSELESKI